MNVCAIIYIPEKGFTDLNLILRHVQLTYTTSRRKSVKDWLSNDCLWSAWALLGMPRPLTKTKPCGACSKRKSKGDSLSDYGGKYFTPCWVLLLGRSLALGSLNWNVCEGGSSCVGWQVFSLHWLRKWLRSSGGKMAMAFKWVRIPEQAKQTSSSPHPHLMTKHNNLNRFVLCWTFACSQLCMFKMLLSPPKVQLYHWICFMSPR